MKRCLTVLAAGVLAFGLAGVSDASAKGKPVATNDLSVVKERVSGPTTVDPRDNTRTDISGDVEVDPNDEGGIVVKLSLPQAYEFTITIKNETREAAVDDLLVYDVIPAEWNLDPLAEDAVDGLDGLCADDVNPGDGCDGVTLDQTAKCSMAFTQPPGAGAGKKGVVPFGQRWKEPELIRILITNLEKNASCVVTVYVITDGNPGHVSVLEAGDPEVEDCTDGASAVFDCVLDQDATLLFTQYEPGKCKVIETVVSDVVYDTVSMNEGVKIFKVAVDSERLVGPEGTLQLTPNGINPGDPADFGEAFCAPPAP